MNCLNNSNISEKFNEFSKLLAIRNNLVIVPENALLEMYKDYNDFLEFVDSVTILLDNDSGFLLLDSSFIDKIFAVFQLHRFDCDKEIKNLLNSIIGLLNNIKSTSEYMKDALVDSYIIYQEEKRHVEFESLDALIESLAYDSVVFYCLTEGHYDDIKVDDYFLMSLYYFISVCPEFFEDDHIFDRCVKIIDSICSDCMNLSKRKRFVKRLKNEVLKLKEE